jgi:membrane protease YdiL (CAAX protease family)
MVWCSRSKLRPLRRIMAILRQLLLPLFRRCTVVDLALVSIAAGVGEELLFRGLIQGAATPWLGTWGAVAVAGLLFGLAHPITTAYIVFAAAMGVYLGVLWVVCDNLLAPIVAHALYDFVALVYLVRRARAAGGEAAPE